MNAVLCQGHSGKNIETDSMEAMKQLESEFSESVKAEVGFLSDTNVLPYSHLFKMYSSNPPD